MQGLRQKNVKPPSKSNRRNESLFDFREMIDGLMKLCADDEVVLCLDREGLIQCINEGAARSWLNQDASGLINRCVWELLPPKVAERRKPIADKVFATGLPQRVAGEHRGRWLDSMVYPVHDQDGNIPLVLILSRDITEYKQKEKKLQESEAHFRKAIAEASVDAIYTVDQSGTIIFWNKAASKLFGYKESEVLGKLNSMLLPKRFRKIDSKAKKQLLKKESYEFKNKLNESVALRKDGTEFPVEITISDWKLNDRRYFTAILRDITERKQYEEALRESEARFRTIAESSQDAIITADSSGKILYWNKAAETMYGYTAEEILGKSIELLRPKNKRLPDRKNREIFLKTGQSRYLGKTVEGEACKKDGTVFLTETSTSYWTLGGQTIFCGIVRDITERKQMEEQLKKSHEELEKTVQQRTADLRVANEKLQISEQHLKEFAATLLSAREEERRNISTTLHDELGSMVLSVTSKLSIAGEEITDNNNDAALKAVIESQAAVRKAVVDLRRVAVDLRPPNLEIMGLTAALTELLAKVREQTKYKIIFRNELAKKKIPEETAIVIYRIVQEAITNITKHANAKNVWIRLSVENKNVNLDISDDGAGCDLDTVLYKKGKPKIGIMGMRERIESLGGEFTLTSTPKKGTQLKVTLPKK